MMKKGIALSEGYAIAEALVIREKKADYSKKVINDISLEKKRLKEAIEKTKEQLSLLRDVTKEKISADAADIFNAHILIADDPEVLKRVEALLKKELCNVEYLINIVYEDFAITMENLDTQYFRERASDLRDVSKRIINNLLKINQVDLSLISKDTIIITHDLKPSQTAQINPKNIKGFITEIGGKTSHSAIIARLLEIPAVCGIKDITSKVHDGDIIVIDGETGDVYINPDQSIIEKYKNKINKYKMEKEGLKKYIGRKTQTIDKHEFHLFANVGNRLDVEKALENDCEGIGLFRTEFLYLDRKSFPKEEEQFEEYKYILEAMGDKSVIIRTLDIGGDKVLPYLKLEEELNPFLGVRAIRLCLSEIEIFKTQLRALLRASIYGNLKIMFPMIAVIEEFRKAKAIFNEVKEELIENEIRVSEYIELGIMVEIPSVAITSKIFAKEVDFFSIGTNDLIQYTFAADRMNHNLSYLYQPLHPVILTLINSVVKAASENNIWVGMCGEMAASKLAQPLLIALGVKELSMSPNSILESRKMISNINKNEAEKILEKALLLSSQDDVIKLLQNYKYS